MDSSLVMATRHARNGTLYGCHYCRSFRPEFQSEIVAGIVEADILDDRPDQLLIVRQFASLHFAAEEIAEYAAKIFMPRK